jgi:uncharacterized membrane protein
MKLEYNWDKSIGPILYFTINNHKVGLCFCHKKKDRSIPCFGLENFFCSRCLGIFFGFLIGSMISYFSPFIPIIWATLLIIPLILDGLSQLIHLRESKNYLRFITGLFFGIGIVVIIKYGLLVLSGIN